MVLVQLLGTFHQAKAPQQSAVKRFGLTKKSEADPASGHAFLG
jgi:hypothetical protein